MSSSSTTTLFFFFTCKPSVGKKNRRRQREDLGQGRGAAILGPNLCAVTALWKYHLFHTAKGAWPSDCLNLHSEETTRCHLKIPEATASVQNSIFAFLLFWSRLHLAHSLIFLFTMCRKAFTDQWFYSYVFSLGFNMTQWTVQSN